MQTSSRIRSENQKYDCAHMGKLVTIGTDFVYPEGLLRGSLPRIVGRKCDHYVDCHLSDKTACPMGLTRINN
jgi:hypothetical protein